MDGLQVEVGIIGVASEDDGTAVLESEVLLDDVLDGDIIGPVGYPICAEHVEATLVKPCGLQHAIASQRDIVACAAVHQQAQCDIGRTVDEEIDVHIGTLFDGGRGFYLFLSGSHSGVVYAPVDEFLVRYGIGIGSVIDENGIGLWRYVKVDDDFLGASMYSHISCGIDGAVEGVVAKVGEIVSQQVLGIDKEVVGKFCQMLVVYATGNDTLMVVDIVDLTVYEFHLVGFHSDGIVAQLIGASGRLDMSQSVENQSAGKVDFVEWTVQSDIACSMSFHLAEEALGERMHEVDVSTCRLDA